MRHFIKPILSWRLSILLLLSILLGGTSQPYVLPKLCLCILSLIVIFQLLLTCDKVDLKDLLQIPVIFGAIFLLLSFLYLIPVPQSIWSGLTLREGVVEGQNLLGIADNWRPIGLTPLDGWVSFWYFTPPIAIAAVMILDLKPDELVKAIKALIIAGILCVLLGLGQYAFGSANLHFYKFSNVGFPTASFSNANHFSTFLLMLIPLAIYQISQTRPYRRRGRGGSGSKDLFLAAMFVAVAIPVTILTDSLSGYMILPICLTLSLLVFFRPFWRWKYKVLALTALIVCLGLFVLDFFVWENYFVAFQNKFVEDGSLSRIDIYRNIWENFEPSALIGTGPGSFYDVYLGFENKSKLINKYANAAHNDFLQIWLEMGLLGIALMVIFTVYIGIKYIIGLIGNRPPLQIIASVSVLVAMTASLVDYPLRTIAVSVMLTFFTVLATNIHRKT